MQRRTRWIGGVLLVACACGTVYGEETGATTRASRDVPWSASAPVAGVNFPAQEPPAWIAPDLCTMVFTSNRGASGASRAYLASRR